MKIPPVEVIANWPKPNYINPETRAPAGRVTGSILLVLATIILVIRLYSRKNLTKGCGLDDLLICLAYLPAAAFTIAGIITQEEFGWARHIWDIEPKFFEINIILTLIHLFLFDLATSLTKLSMLAMVRRLTAVSNNKLENAAVLTLAILITANCFIFIMVEIFQCRPVSSAWMLQGGSHNCIDEEAHLMAANVINTATDFAVVLLPIQTAMRARLSARQRTIVISLFGIGLIGSAAGISRTYFTWNQFYAANYDVTWRAWYVWVSSLIELHLGIICASVPATKPFFTSFTQRRKISPAVLPLSPPSPIPYTQEEISGLQAPLPLFIDKSTFTRRSSPSITSTNKTDSFASPQRSPVSIAGSNTP
ncbi:integral membrane protein [Xylaria sp. FL0043]|nr:integral membrane protein [Xylaria sp. FL0043]